MVKMRHKGLLVLGITKREMDALRDGAPLPIALGDLHPSLKGQNVLIIPGNDNASLERVLSMAADAYDNGATSVIEVAKTLPRTRIQ